MKAFSEEELAYLSEGNKLARLATIDPTGQPHNVPLGWSYNAHLGTIDITGRDLATTRKFRNVQSNPLVCLVIDDVLPPWQPRYVQIRGHAEALEAAIPAEGGRLRPIIRITPAKIVSLGLNPSGRS